MAYFIVTKEICGEITRVGPIASDSPSGKPDDKSVMRKAEAWAEKIRIRFGLDCFVESE